MKQIDTLLVLESLFHSPLLGLSTGVFYCMIIIDCVGIVVLVLRAGGGTVQSEAYTYYCIKEWG